VFGGLVTEDPVATRRWPGKGWRSEKCVTEPKKKGRVSVVVVVVSPTLSSHLGADVNMDAAQLYEATHRRSSMRTNWFGWQTMSIGGGGGCCP